MNKTLQFLSAFSLLLGLGLAHSAPSQTELAVWANEAIIATYSYDSANYLNAQKEMAKYFTANAWIAYTKALNDSHLLETVKKNNYTVTAVATSPPKISVIDPTHWQAIMPILVLYNNANYQQQQQQNLQVNITFTTVPSGQGIRGLSLTSLKSTQSSPPCVCKNPA